MLKPVTILGIYACDLTFLADRLPAVGETVIGSGFRMGPGGKGSNQAIAARRSGSAVNFIAKLGDDAFGEQARQMYLTESVTTQNLITSREHATGTAFIYVNNKTGQNAIIVSPGAAGKITREELDACEQQIASSSLFMTQLEVPLDVAAHGLQIAKKHGVITILNPAPAALLTDAIYANIDYFTPNESEAAALSGLAVETIAQARASADVFLDKGVNTVIITLGEKGVLLKSSDLCEHIPAFQIGDVVDTTGAGDAFNGGFATALAQGRDLIEAARFGCATAALSVTRPGCASSMPARDEIEQLLAQKL